MKKLFANLALVLLICALTIAIVGCQPDKPEPTPHTHQYTEEITKAPSCTEAGVKTFTCSGEGCDKPTYTETIEKLGHKEQTLDAVAPTCTETGLTEGKKCADCGTVLKAQDTVPATGHSYTDNYDATCNNEGCDFVRDADCRHDNTTPLAAQAPTCTETGLTEGVKCKDCDEILTKQEILPALTHDWAAATCTDPKTCKRDGCNATEGEALGHHWSNATCTDPKTCQRDGCNATEGDALGHKWNDATCTAPKSCSVCSKTEGEALGHKWSDATCTDPKTCQVCKLTDGEKLGHNYTAPTYVWSDDFKSCTATKVCQNDKSHVVTQTVDSTVQTSSATCTSAGVVTYTATFTVNGFAKQTKTVTVAMLPHTYGATDYAWSSDYSSCTAVKYCTGTNCYSNISETVTAKVTTVESTCTAAGSVTYTADFKNSNFEDQTHKIDLAIKKHNLVSDSKPASCTETGLTAILKCTNCTYTEGTQHEIPLQPHTYDDSNGYATECSVCHAARPACQHSDTITIKGYAATCSKEGLTDGQKCKACGHIVVGQTTIPKKEHTPGAAATCTEDQICTECKVVLAVATNHSFTAPTYTWIENNGEIVACKASRSCQNGCGTNENVTVNADAKVVSEPKCEQAGSKVYTAVFTSGSAFKTQTKTVELAPVGHNYSAVVTKPTCTEGGYTTHTCSKCGNGYTDSELPALDHSFTKYTSNNDAACLVDGTKTAKCDRCDETDTKADEGSKLGHSFTKYVSNGDATCTKDGTETAKCDRCDVTDSRTAVGSMLDHTYDKSVADEKYCASEATCTAGAIYYKSCICGAKGTETFETDSKLGHSFTNYVSNGDATCTQNGTETAKCDRCDETDTKVDEGSKLGHSFTNYVSDGNATCTADGTKTAKCDHCDATDIKVDEGTKLSHTFTEYKSNNDATCTADGTETAKCDHCDATDNRIAEGSKTDHTYPDSWNHDDDKHWRKCTGCDATESGSHDEFNKNCFCGYENEHRVVNGNFDKGLDGWEFNNTLGEAPFAGIDEKNTFWGEGYPMFNVGKYFSSYADGASEGSQGTLASSYFVVGGKGYATYMLGGAGNHNVYITIENKNGDTLALYRNTKFRDFTDEDNKLPVEQRYELIGDVVFLCNFVSYKVDLSAWAGQEIRFVIHDYASEGWGVVYFDQLNTYHTAEPEGILAENLLANKSALNAELALEVSAQGDYTLESYEEYLKALAAAKALVNDIAVTQKTVNEATAALTAARNALAVRPVEEVEGADKSFNLISGDNKEITLSDYINTNGLSSITYDVSAGNAAVTLSDIADGKFTITAAKVDAATTAQVTIAVKYNGETKLTVTLDVNVTNDVAPTVKAEEITKSYDIFTLDNKQSITLDLSENVDNAGKLALTYYVNGAVVDGSTYTFTYGDYNDTATTESFSVTVAYTANGQQKTISYTYKLEMKDTTAYRLVNGGFENGMEGWNKVGNIGDVSSNRSYWNGEFGMDGDKMFSGYEPVDLEKHVGILTSSTFTVGGSGFVTFKIGAMRDQNYVYVDVVEAGTGKILARYYNGLWKDNETHCTLVAYVADLSAFMGKEVYFRLSDNADSGYGLIFADSFVTYYESKPEGFNEATHVSYALPGTVYDLFNGGFEMGDVQGWWNEGEIGLVTNANGYWGDNIPYGKHGEYLFTGVESHGGINTMKEVNKGVLSSSIFEIGGTGKISFMLGGGGNEQCYIQIVNAATGEVLARYHQQAQRDAVLIQYVADLSAYANKGIFARVQVVDYATSGWGCVSFDNVVTYYPEGAELPAGETANNIYNGSYDIVNGSFETGNLDGWTQDIWEAGAHNTLGYVVNEEHSADWYTSNDGRKDGEYLMTFVKKGDKDNCENTKGALISSTFTLKKDSYVSFKFGAAYQRAVRIELVRTDGTVIATFYNEPAERVNTQLYSYYYKYTGETADCFFRVVDDANGGPYGCFVVDDFRVNLDKAPEGFMEAIR